MAIGSAPIDDNRNPMLAGVSSSDYNTVVSVAVDPTTHALLSTATLIGGGDASSANQTSGNQKTQIVDSGGNAVTVTGNKLDVNASVSTTGLATSTKQSDGSQKTQLVDGSGNVIGSTSNSLNVNVTGGGSGGGAVTVADGADVTLGAIADVVVAAGAAGTISAKLRRLTTDLDAIKTSTTYIANQTTTVNTGAIAGTVTANAGTNLNTSALALETGGNLAAIKAKTDNIPAQGQALAAASMPVVLPAAQVTTLTPPAAITGFATDAKLDTIITDLGGVTETAPATDTASSGHNGRLQRIAQRITSLIALLPTALGTGGGLKVDGSGTALPVSGTVTANNATAANLKAEVSNAGTFATQTTLQTGSAAIGKLTANDAVDIGDVTINNASGASAVNIQDGGNSITVDGAVTAAGDIAHDGADSGNPIKVGAKATTSLAGLTLVSDTDRTNLLAGVDGVQITRPYCNLEDILTGNASNTDGTATSLIAAQGAGIKTYLTTIILTNMSATGGYVEIKDDTTVKMTIPIPAGGGAIINLPVPLGGTANKAWNFDPSAALTTVYASAVGFKSKV